MICGHGNNIYQYENRQIRVDFSSNIAFNNNAEEILTELGQRLDVLRDYPDSMASQLTSQLATYHGVTTDNILVTNGSTEAFYLIAQHLASTTPQRCRTAITTPSFAEYEDSCKLFGHDIDQLRIKDLNNSSSAGYHSLWLASPNNPDGYRIPISKIFGMATTNPACTLILDRAYNELSSEDEVCGALPTNVILVESFTKYYGIPGLRLGYIVASAPTIDAINRLRQPWSVNALALVAGGYILSHLDQLKLNVKELIEESHYLQHAINQIDGLRVEPSNCNFFVVEITSGATATELYDYLLTQHALLIRNCSNFRGLGDNYIRIAAQHRADNNLLINALQTWR